MAKFYKVTMFVEVDERLIDNDCVYHNFDIRDTLERSPVIRNVDIDSCREVDISETPY
jgi:hypothetical protein